MSPVTERPINREFLAILMAQQALRSRIVELTVAGLIFFALGFGIACQIGV